MAMLVLALMASPTRAEDNQPSSRTGLQAIGVDELVLVALLVCIAAVAIWEAVKGACACVAGWLRKSPKQRRNRKLRDAAKATAEEEVDRAFLTRQAAADEPCSSTDVPCLRHHLRIPVLWFVQELQES